ncbi:MAG: type VI secretion system tip protein VgrG, partial [Myxococcales bacterium]|nr:type VI secretion system tip protein VgrG [Myxococcales bacterium]
EIHTDEFGRVRVQFHWDREGALDERSSCWIRVSQAWAGASFGMMVIPRVGQEVLVDFFDGDPDRPIVVGRVYNNTTRVPYPLPENKTRSTWKSDSSPGSGGFNEIMFEDRKGAELMSIQAERNRSTVVKRDDTLSVGSNRSATIGQNDSLAVGANHSVTVGGSQSISVVGGRGSTIGTSDSIDAGEMYQLQVAKNGTGMRVIDNRIVISTAEACIVIDNDTIRLEANGNIILRAGESIVLNAGAPIAIDGEQVLLNCQGRDPQMVETVDAAADPGGPGGPDPGQRSVAAEKLSVSPAAARRPGGIADVRVRPDVPVPDEVIASLPTSPGAAPSALDLPPAVAEVISQAAGEGGGAAEAAARVLLRGPEGVMELVQLAAGEVAAALPSSAGRVLGPVLSAVSEGADAATLGSRLAPAIAEAFGAGERFAVIQQAASDLAPIFAAVRTQAAPGFFDAATMVRQAAAFEAAGMGPAQAASVAAATQGIALYQGDASGQLEKLPTE